jgi:hypothetical protein
VAGREMKRHQANFVQVPQLDTVVVVAPVVSGLVNLGGVEFNVVQPRVFVAIGDSFDADVITWAKG